MAKNFMLKCMLALFFIPVQMVQAKENTPIETFINNVKLNNNVVPVTNIWQPDNNFDQKPMLEVLEKGQPLTIDYASLASFMKQQSRAIELSIPGIGGGTYTLELGRYDFFTNDFQVHEMGENNTDKQVSYTPGLYYRGVVKGIPNSVVAFSFFNNEVYGIFSIPGEGNYVLAPNTMVGDNYNAHFIVYNDRDLKLRDQAPGCATDQLPVADRNKASKTTTTANNKVFNNCTEVRCFETADYSMYVKKGGTGATNSTNYITSMFNNKSTLYLNEGIMITLKYVQVNTATDAYQSLATNSSTWLNKFGDVTMNVMHGCDIATLFTTHSGNMGGVAWLNAMCQSYSASSHFGPYTFCNIDATTTLTATNVPTFSWDVEVSTHEMGHGLGSPHTHRCCWNPPGTGTTAIDGCYTLEGSCATPTPAHPAGGGTIMSYCHLTSVGINFALGFGIQPGDTVRSFIANTFSSVCGLTYTPSTVSFKPNRTVSATRECTDMNTGTTYYWNDNATASQTDDTLVLMINKGTANIGNLNTSGFSVSANTIASYGSGIGDTVIFPTGTPVVSSTNKEYTMRRYWKIAGATTPSAAVEVIFPFLSTDTADVSGCISTASPITNFKMYKVNSPVDPNPALNFASAVGSNFSIYTYGTTASTANWSLSTVGTTQLAHMKMTNLNGGGTGFYQYSSVGVANINGAGAGISIYPNPTSNEWYVAAGPNNNSTMDFQLFTADGRMVHTQTLQSGVTNTVSAANIAPGIYFYRIVSGDNVYTGNLSKK
jgi:hypothetical protein